MSKSLVLFICLSISKLCVAQYVKPNLNLKGNKLGATVTQLISFKTEDDNFELDTAGCLEFTMELELLNEESYSLTLDNFKSKVPFSNFEELNKLIDAYRANERYVLETNLDFTEFEIQNKKHIQEQAKTYMTDITSRIRGTSHNSITIPYDSKGAIQWCTELIDPIFNGYKIDLNKNFEGPVQVGLPEPNHMFKDTLHIKANMELPNPNIETSMWTSGDEISHSTGDHSFTPDFYMFSTTRYFLTKEGRIGKVDIHAGNGSDQHSGEMRMVFDIKFSE